MLPKNLNLSDIIHLKIGKFKQITKITPLLPIHMPIIKIPDLDTLNLDIYEFGLSPVHKL